MYMVSPWTLRRDNSFDVFVWDGLVKLVNLLQVVGVNFWKILEHIYLWSKGNLFIQTLIIFLNLSIIFRCECATCFFLLLGVWNFSLFLWLITPRIQISYLTFAFVYWDYLTFEQFGNWALNQLICFFNVALKEVEWKCQWYMDATHDILWYWISRLHFVWWKYEVNKFWSILLRGFIESIGLYQYLWNVSRCLREVREIWNVISYILPRQWKLRLIVQILCFPICKESYHINDILIFYSRDLDFFLQASSSMF